MNIKQNTFSRLCFFFFRGKIEKIEGKKKQGREKGKLFSAAEGQKGASDDEVQTFIDHY